MFRKFRQKLNGFLFNITPHIHRLPTVTYIRWMNKDYFLPKF